jgi:hypothetical protein
MRIASFFSSNSSSAAALVRAPTQLVYAIGVVISSALFGAWTTL